jgi:hypothetical protein
MTSTVRAIVAIALALFTGGLLLPTAIAVAHNHPKVVSVLLWNTLGLLLLGLGWIVALVISLTGADGPQQPVVIHQTIVQHYAAREDQPKE